VADLSILGSAAAIGIGHTLIVAWLTRRLLAGLSSPISALTVLPGLRVTLSILAALSFVNLGVAAGLAALAGFWLGRTITVLTLLPRRVE
jgi:hypothetical protein